MGVIYGLIAALLFSAANALIKVSTQYLSVYQIGTGRFAIGLIFIPILAFVMGFTLKGKGMVLITIRSLASLIAFFLLMLAFKKIPLSTAMVLFYLFPVFSALLEPFITGRKTPVGDWPYITGAFIGAVIILWKGETGFDLNLGHMLAIFAAILAALGVILIRRVIPDNNAWNIYFYFSIFGLIGFAIPLAVSDAPVLPQNMESWLLILAIGITTILAQVSMSRALNYIAAARFGVIMTLEVLGAALFGMIALKEPFTIRFLVGGSIIIGCAIGLNLSMLQKKNTINK